MLLKRLFMLTGILSYKDFYLPINNITCDV